MRGYGPPADRILLPCSCHVRPLLTHNVHRIGEQDMNFFYGAGQSLGVGYGAANIADVRQKATDLDEKVREMQLHTERLSIACQALWEILREKSASPMTSWPRRWRKSTNATGRRTTRPRRTFCSVLHADGPSTPAAERASTAAHRFRSRKRSSRLIHAAANVTPRGRAVLWRVTPWIGSGDLSP